MKLTQLKDVDYQRYRRYYQTIIELQKKPNTHAYMTVAFTFLAISLFGWYAIKPTLQTILFLRKEIADKTEVNQKMEEKIAALIDAQESFAQAEPLLPLIAGALPPTPDAVNLIGQLRNLADSSQASLSTMLISDVSVTGDSATASAQKSSGGGKTEEISLSLTATGPFPALQSFLSGIIDMRRIVTVDSVTISPNVTRAQQEVSTSPLQLVAKLRSYYLPN